MSPRSWALGFAGYSTEFFGVRRKRHDTVVVVASNGNDGELRVLANHRECQRERIARALNLCDVRIRVASKAAGGKDFWIHICGARSADTLSEAAVEVNFNAVRFDGDLHVHILCCCWCGCCGVASSVIVVAIRGPPSRPLTVVVVVDSIVAAVVVVVVIGSAARFSPPRSVIIAIGVLLLSNAVIAIRSLLLI